MKLTVKAGENKYGIYFMSITAMQVSLMVNSTYFSSRQKLFLKACKPCYVGIHLNLDEHSQMSTHVPGFHLFLLV